MAGVLRLLRVRGIAIREKTNLFVNGSKSLRRRWPSCDEHRSTKKILYLRREPSSDSNLRALKHPVPVKDAGSELSKIWNQNRIMATLHGLHAVLPVVVDIFN